MFIAVTQVAGYTDLILGYTVHGIQIINDELNYVIRDSHGILKFISVDDMDEKHYQAMADFYVLTLQKAPDALYTIITKEIKERGGNLE